MLSIGQDRAGIRQRLRKLLLREFERAGQIGAAKIGHHELRAAKSRSGENRAGEIAAANARIAKIAFAKVGMAERRLNDFASRKFHADHRRPSEIAMIDSRSDEAGR